LTLLDDVSGGEKTWWPAIKFAAISAGKTRQAGQRTSGTQSKPRFKVLMAQPGEGREGVARGRRVK